MEAIRWFLQYVIRSFSLDADNQQLQQLQQTSSPIPQVFDYKGVKIKAGFPHLEGKMEAVVTAPKFTRWFDEFNFDEIDLREFTVTDVDFFGPVDPKRLGFVKGTGVAFDKETGDAIPAIVFIRGAAVAVLIVVKVRETDKRYVLLCKQLRFPSGRSLIEACAGMVDHATRNIVGVVFNEVKEETGFVINETALIPLGEIIPSGGGCDEIIHLYAWETEVSLAEFEEKKIKVYGDGKHEKIKLIFYEYDTFDNEVDALGDVKAECCWRRYLKHLQKSSTFIPVN